MYQIGGDSEATTKRLLHQVSKATDQVIIKSLVMYIFQTPFIMTDFYFDDRNYL